MKTAVEIAEILLKNTPNIYMQAELDGYINVKKGDEHSAIYNGYDIEDIEDNCDFTTVFDFIARDGYDISDFGLWEIPIKEVYCFMTNTKDLDGSKEAAKNVRRLMSTLNARKVKATKHILAVTAMFFLLLRKQLRNTKGKVVSNS